MQELLNVNPRAVIHQITLVRCGYGSNIELFQYSSPDQKNLTAEEQRHRRLPHRLLCRRHQGGEGYLDGKGVKTFFGPFPVNEGPAAGQSIVYFLAPWGLQMELISYPKGMAYEHGASTVLWSPKDPAK